MMKVILPNLNPFIHSYHVNENDKRKSTIMKNGKALLGIIAGIAAGTAIGVLIAPHKGWRTRKFIKRRVSDLADVFNEKIEEKLEDSLGRPFRKCKKSEQPSEKNTVEV